MDRRHSYVRSLSVDTSSFPQCRFCNQPIAERSVESTDGQRSHPGCYQRWVQKTLAEIA